MSEFEGLCKVLTHEDFMSFSEQVRMSIRQKRKALCRAKVLQRRLVYCKRALEDELAFAKKNGVCLNAL